MSNYFELFNKVMLLKYDIKDNKKVIAENKVRLAVLKPQKATVRQNIATNKLNIK